MKRSRLKFSGVFSLLFALSLAGYPSAARAQSTDLGIVTLASSTAESARSTEDGDGRAEEEPPRFSPPADSTREAFAFGEVFSSSSRTKQQRLPQWATEGFVAIQPRPASREGVQWEGLMTDSTRFLLFQHAFRLATETDTRAGLSGPFFRDYKDSVANIHGWNDGDPFFVNYIDHPMEGSVAGFLEVAHDPRYRRLEIGNSAEYWKSRFRAMAFSAAFSLQFEIGPISEASIGNIQKDPKKTGVVDWVITPVVGMGWMIGEDAIDKYIVRRFESRTQSHFKRILLRGVLNPSRSFANMMQGKVPWHRDSRPGVREF